MNLVFGYGEGVQEVFVPDEHFMGELHANDIPDGPRGQAAVVAALQNPIGAQLLRQTVHNGQTVAIVTSDITRPMPTALVMPALLDELYAGGINPSDITLVFALGSHRSQTQAERQKLAGERAYREIRCIDSDPDDCIRMGTTRHGTPVDITRVVAEADIRICLGNIEYHYFAGYSGGAKAIMPGVSTRAAIQHNHSMMVDPACCAGELDGNKLRMDIEEAGQICGIHFILNVVLSEHKEILYAVAGDCIAAHRAGCSYLDTLYLKVLSCGADIVLVSQGGAPKDLNLYQTQKALDNAKHAVNPGGVIILIGSCREGLGESTFEQWMLHSPSPQAMIDRIRVDFQLGGHKATAIAMVLQKSDVYLVSDLEPDFVRSIHLTPQESAQAALDCALEKLGQNASILAMPYGGSILPRVSNNQQEKE